MTRNHMVYNSNNVTEYFETFNDIIMRFNLYYTSFKWHSLIFWVLKYFWLLSVYISKVLVEDIMSAGVSQARK